MVRQAWTLVKRERAAPQASCVGGAVGTGAGWDGTGSRDCSLMQVDGGALCSPGSSAAVAASCTSSYVAPCTHGDDFFTARLLPLRRTACNPSVRPDQDVKLIALFCSFFYCALLAKPWTTPLASQPFVPRPAALSSTATHTAAGTPALAGCRLAAGGCPLPRSPRPLTACFVSQSVLLSPTAHPLRRASGAVCYKTAGLDLAAD